MRLRRQVFVAISFDQKFQPRFDTVIEPAIGDHRIDGVALKSFRVDLNKSGDSILTDIVDGISHSQLVVADVSTIGRDSISGRPFRNANVMYEVGLALAIRQPEEVLLLRDDSDDFLFDVSTIPHMQVQFDDIDTARRRVSAEIGERLRLQVYMNDLRVERALRGLSIEEFEVLESFRKYPEASLCEPDREHVNFRWMTAMPRLLDKGIVELHGALDGKYPAYRLTELGSAVNAKLESHVRNVKVSRIRTSQQ
jgi:hypothetical protein